MLMHRMRRDAFRRTARAALAAETPLVIPYFINGLTASTPKVKGLNPTSIAQIFLKDASISA